MSPPESGDGRWTMTPGDRAKLEGRQRTFAEIPARLDALQAAIDRQLLDLGAALEDERAMCGRHQVLAARVRGARARASLDDTRKLLDEAGAVREAHAQVRRTIEEALWAIDRLTNDRFALEEQREHLAEELARRPKTFDLSPPEEGAPRVSYDPAADLAHITAQTQTAIGMQDELKSRGRIVDGRTGLNEERLLEEATRQRAEDALDARALPALRAALDRVRVVTNGPGRAGALSTRVREPEDRRDAAGQVEELEAQLEADRRLRHGAPALGGLATTAEGHTFASLHERLAARFPRFAAAYPRLGMSPSQRRWVEQRIAYLRALLRELPAMSDGGSPAGQLERRAQTR